jgi:hypothetical protein
MPSIIPLLKEKLMVVSFILWGNKYDYGQTGRRFGGLTNAISDATREVDQTGRQ